MQPTTVPDAIREDLYRHLRKMVEIGIALSSENNIDILFEMIVEEARALSNADSGTLYILDRDRNVLRFKILQNASLGIRAGGASSDVPMLPDVPLYHGNAPNFANVSAYVALKGKILNIPDVYNSTEFDFTGPRTYDRETGYQSRSMIVIPMKNHAGEVIGVLQLLNALDPATGRVVAFDENCVDLVASLASQAAIALTNRQLLQEMKRLFYSFIESIAFAIDEKSPYTGGHIKRVVKIVMALAAAVNRAEDGPFGTFRFDEDELEELRLSAWMHDVGKITTPEYVMDKATRLESIFDRIQLIETRFQLIAQMIENQHLEKMLRLQAGAKPADRHAMRLAEDLKKGALAQLENDLDFIRDCDRGRTMTEENLRQLDEIAKKTYRFRGNVYPYLEPWEIENLSITAGTLNPKERKVVENHALMTLKMLSRLPFPKSLARVPDFAASHHEKINGTGYPRQLGGGALSLQARIIAIADIFEALSARDRPYRQKTALSQTIDIMQKMKEEGHIDPNLFDLLIQTDIIDHIDDANAV